MKDTLKQAALDNLDDASLRLDTAISMVGQELPCDEVMDQIRAVRQSLEAADRILVQNHIETCVREALADGTGGHDMAELLAVLDEDSAKD